MKHRGVQELFSEMARSNGSRVAMEGAERRVSYGELERRSNQLGWRLLREGVGEGSMVGLVGEDAVEMVVGILGILKAGGVFVPLDGGFPQKRLETMIGQVKPEWYVVESRLEEKLLQVAGGESRYVRVDGEELEQESREELEVERDGEGACSVYFTSGSTGRPKAILGRLKGIDHFVRWEIETLAVQPGTRVSQLSSPSFDGFLKDVFVPLSAGAVVCLPSDRGVVLDGERLGEWVEEAGVEILHCVPSVWRSLLNEKLTAERWPGLKWVVLAGEAVLIADVRRWMSIFGQRIRLVNLYGPTETTIIKTAHIIEPQDVERPSIPIGKPLPGAAVMILNAGGQPCRPGAVGEIYIRTPYRALGYYGAPELTQQAFLQNPFTQDLDDIVYRTGDFGRLLEDGNIEFLGRKDQQVKVRGVRVELGEIENVLREHGGVKDVAVVDREDSEGNKYLCAYVVCVEGVEFSAGELRGYALGRLPEAMTPSGYVEMKELPRTLNGKIDRKGLPLLEEKRGGAGVGVGVRQRPRTPVEEIVAGIWEEVLRQRGIGVEDNFFESGGHSLLATKVMLRIRKALGIELPLRALFEAPTVGEMARRVEQELRTGERAEVLPIEAVERNGAELPLSYAQQRLWFVAQLEPEHAAYNMPFAIRLKGELDAAALRKSVNEIVRRHEVLRTRFPERGGMAVQEIRAVAELPVCEIVLEHLPAEERGEEARRLAGEEMLRPFDLAADWLLRVSLVRLERTDHVLLVSMHHIVSDAWSIGILVSEFSQLYQAYSQGHTPRLPQLRIQYADFSLWQRSWLHPHTFQKQLEYWKTQLAGLRPSKLPTSPSDSRSSASSGKEEIIQISQELARKLHALSNREGVTLFMTLVAAFQLALARQTGQTDVSIGTDVANRTAIETESLIGFFVNQLVLRTDLSGEPSFREVLRRVRHTVLGAYANQDLPFEKLVDELQPQRRLGENPLFSIKLVLQNVPYSELSLPGLAVEGLELHGAPPKFDILVNLMETEKGITVFTQYNAGLYRAGAIKGLLQSYGAILTAVAGDDNVDLPQPKLMSLIEQKLYSSVAHAVASGAARGARLGYMIPK